MVRNRRSLPEADAHRPQLLRLDDTEIPGLNATIGDRLTARA
jgi:hypothetical protein